MGRELPLPGGAIALLQPADAAELPDDGAFEWAPLVPYSEVLWRSGLALARAVAETDMRGLRLVEIGCGLGVASLVAARGGADVLATDRDREALRLLDRNARENGLTLATARVDWTRPEDLIRRGPFDLVLAADVLYEAAAVEPLLELLTRLGTAVWLADPGRAPAGVFLERAAARWAVGSDSEGGIGIHRLRARG